MKKLFPALLSFVVLMLLAEIAVRMGLVPAFLIPAPTQVLGALFENLGEFAQATAQTFSGTLWGFLLSVVTGGLLAVAFSWSAFLRQAVLPFAVFFQTVPIIAIAPLLVIYFGFGPPTVIAASFIVSFFPIVANTLLGLQSVDPAQVDLFRLYGASPCQELWKLRLPSAYPSIYAGLKVSWGLAIIGAIAGEFVAGGGLGALIDSARTQQRIDLVFGALLLLALMGLGGLWILQLLHHLLQKIRPLGIHLKD